MSRPPRGNTGRPIRLLIAAAAVVAAGAGIFFAAAQATHSGAQNATVAAAQGHGASKTTSAAPTVHDILFVGASYTAGLGATPQTEGYAYLVGRAPGWQAQIYGVSGTGFLNPGPQGNGTFAQRVAHLPTHPHPDLVVFQGGRNDVNYPAAQLRTAAINTVELARKRFLGAQVIFLGPIPASVPAPADQVAVATTLRSAAAASKAIFIDPIEQQWITPENQDDYTGHVAAHPGNDGYAYIAKRLLIDLNALYPNHADA